MYTFYAYWNGEQVTAVLNAIALIMNGDDYMGLIKAISVVGILVAAGTALVRMRGEEPLGYFIMFSLFYGTLFVPKTTVTVQDLRTANVYTVANVPLGVAFFAAETSHIGKWLTEAFETNFTAVDDLKFEKNGLAFGARLVEQLQAVKVTTPSLQQDLILFVKNCVNPELLDNPGALNELVRSNELWAFIGGTGSFSLNPGRSTLVNGAALSCGGAGGGGAYQQLSAALAVEANGAAADLGKRVNPGHPNANTIILSQIPAIEGVMMNVSRTAQEAIKQGMVMNLMRDSQTTIAQLQGNANASQVALAVSMAEQSSVVSYASMAKIAQGALPILRNGVELIVIAVFPIVFILVIVAGAKAGMVLRSYVMSALWVQLWAPLYAVINFMLTKSHNAEILGVADGGNTLLNMGSISQLTLSDQSIAGLLTVAVPMIALALVKGGEVAMSGVTSSIMSPAQGAAQKAGDSVGQGNVNAGNVSWGNTNAGNMSMGNWGSGNSSFNNAGANKNDRSSAWADPQISSTTTPRGSFTQDGQGNVTGMQANRWDVGGNVSAGTSTSRSSMDSSGDMTRATNGRSASLDISSAATSGNRSSAEFARQLTTALATGVGTNGQWSDSSRSVSSRSASAETSGSSQLTNQQSARLGTNANFKAGADATAEYGPYGGSDAGGGTSGSRAQANQGPGNGMHAAQPASRGSGNTLPVPAGGTPQGDESKAGPTVRGRANLGFGIGGGFDASNTQALIDTALNKGGKEDRKTQESAAQRVMSAVDSVMKNTNDAGVRSAAQSFSADFQKAVRAGEQQSASVQTERSAGNTKQQGTQNQAGGSISMGAPVAQQLLAMANGDPIKALQLAGNSQAVAQATLAAAAQVQSSQEGGAILGAGGVQAPTGQGQVKAQGNADVNALAGQARAAAVRADGGNRQQVQAVQPASPTSSPNTSAAVDGFNAQTDAAITSQQLMSGDTSLGRGAAAAADALYRENQGGVGTLVANTLIGGAGYQSAQEYQAALEQAAGSSPKLAATLRSIGDSDRPVSPQAREYIESELKAYEDSQPSFLSKQLDRLTGG